MLAMGAYIHHTISWSFSTHQYFPA